MPFIITLIHGLSFSCTVSRSWKIGFKKCYKYVTLNRTWKKSRCTPGNEIFKPRDILHLAAGNLPGRTEGPRQRQGIVQCSLLMCHYYSPLSTWSFYDASFLPQGGAGRFFYGKKGAERDHKRMDLWYQQPFWLGGFFYVSYRNCFTLMQIWVINA